MPKNSALDKIRNGIGLEDADVRAYISEKAEKRARRMETYKKVDSLISKLSKEKKPKS